MVFLSVKALFAVAVTLSQITHAAPGASAGSLARQLLQRALGINCRGSFFCGSSDTPNDVDFLVDAGGKIDMIKTYHDGEHIVCRKKGGSSGVCAFLQYTEKGTKGEGRKGPLIKTLLGEIQNHKCKDCGSVPVTFPKDEGGSNDPKDGILTINYVSDIGSDCGADDGICENARPLFRWAAVGDSWTTGVRWSKETTYRDGKCARATESWPAQMEEDTTWTTAPQQFHFAACAGSKFDAVKGQMPDTGTPSVILGTTGGNNANFGDLVDACFLRAFRGHDYGPPWDNDPLGTGDCKKLVAKTEGYIRDSFDGDLRRTLDDVFGADAVKNREEFWLYLSLYAHFFNSDTDDCSKWSFAPWWSKLKPKLVKPLRKLFNDDVTTLNNAYISSIRNYAPPPNRHISYIEITSAFDAHRFCEPSTSFEDQWYSPNTWIWNLQFYDRQDPETTKRMTPKTDEDGAMYMDQAPGDTIDNYNFKPGQPVDSLSSGSSGSGDGWIGRTFHPKKQGNARMKEVFVGRLRADMIPYVKQ